MGRLLVFLARINPNPSQGPQNGKIRGIGIEERVSVLLEPNGQATVVGQGSAYLVQLMQKPAALAEGKPLTGATYAIQKIPSGKSFDMTNWENATEGAINYTFTVEAGKIHSTQAANAIY
jgi:cyanophycinase-like exopeptidase